MRRTAPLSLLVIVCALGVSIGTGVGSDPTAGPEAVPVESAIPAVASHGEPHATITYWDLLTDTLISGEPILGFDPHETVDDLSGLTNQVGTPALVTAMQNTDGGFCGLLFWNPDTNTFKSYAVGGGFNYTVDIDRRPPHGTTMTDTFGGGDTWSAINGNSAHSPYMNFRGSDTFRRWDIDAGDATGIRVHPTNGKVYLGNFSRGMIFELDPPTNVVRSWATGARVNNLVVDGDFVYATGINNGADQPDQILRLNVADNSAVRWDVPGGGFDPSGPTDFGTPNSIAQDPDGDIWFTQSGSDEIGRLDPAQNHVAEYGKAGISNPHSIATSGSGSSLQAFFTEAGSFEGTDEDRGHISLLAPIEATTSTITVPRSDILTPTAPVTVSFVDFVVDPVTAQIAPKVFDAPGIDPPGIVRFPVPPDTSAPNGISRGATTDTVFGSLLGADGAPGTSSHVFRLQVRVPITQLSLSPRQAVNPVGSSHTVTAAVVRDGAPVPGVQVAFSVTDGPNAGQTGSGTTNAQGQTTFTYSSNGSVGTDTIVSSATVDGQSLTDQVTKTWVSSRPPTCPGPLWYLAEGSTRTGIDEYILMFNTDSSDATVEVLYTVDGGPNVTKVYNIPALSRLTVDAVADLGRDKDHGTVVTADRNILVERSMYINRSIAGLAINGDHNAVAEAEPRLSWYFSEGTSLTDFQTYFTVANPGAADTLVTVTYGIEGGGTVTRTKALPQFSRITIDANSADEGVGPGVVGFSTVIAADQPILAERPVYFDHPFPFAPEAGGDVRVNGATDSFGVSPGRSWYVAEGNVLPDFAMFLTIGNPTASTAAATITYNLEGSAPLVKSVSVAPNSRLTVQTFNEGDQAGIGRNVSDPVSRGVGVGVTSDTDIVVERAMYFQREIDGALPRIFDGHATSGYPGFEKLWYFAEGTGLPSFRTFLTLTNPQVVDADVTITYYPDDSSGAVVKTVSVPAGQRRTIQTYSAAEVGGYGAGKTGFSMKVEATQPILAERPEYENHAFPSGLINGGNVSLGLPDTCI